MEYKGKGVHVSTDHTWTANTDLFVYEFFLGGGADLCVCSCKYTIVRTNSST